MKNKVGFIRLIIAIILSILFFVLPWFAIEFLLSNPNVSANYFYDGPDVNYEWGKVSIATQGVGSFYSPFKVPEKDDRTIKVDNVCGDFLICFEAHGVMNGTVKVTDLEITDLDNNIKIKTPKISCNNMPFVERKLVKWDSTKYREVEYGSGPYVSNVSTESDRLKFVDYKITFNFTIKTAEKEISKKATLYLKKREVIYSRGSLLTVQLKKNQYV